jgi:hypothetical protein
MRAARRSASQLTDQNFAPAYYHALLTRRISFFQRPAYKRVQKWVSVRMSFLESDSMHRTSTETLTQAQSKKATFGSFSTHDAKFQAAHIVITSRFERIYN